MLLRNATSVSTVTVSVDRFLYFDRFIVFRIMFLTCLETVRVLYVHIIYVHMLHCCLKLKYEEN